MQFTKLKMMALSGRSLMEEDPCGVLSHLTDIKRMNLTAERSPSQSLKDFPEVSCQRVKKPVKARDLADSAGNMTEDRVSQHECKYVAITLGIAGRSSISLGWCEPRLP